MRNFGGVPLIESQIGTLALDSEFGQTGLIGPSEDKQVRFGKLIVSVVLATMVSLSLSGVGVAQEVEPDVSINHLIGTETLLDEDDTASVQFNFTNTGNTSWTFGAGASLRRPDSSLVDLPLQSKTLDPGAGTSVSWSYTADQAGEWDLRCRVWQETAEPLVNCLADTGWNVDYITVTETELAANINHLIGTETLLDKDDTASVQFNFTNTGNTSWTFGAGASLRRPDNSLVDLSLQSKTLSPGAGTSVSWTYTADQAGEWDLRCSVWKETASPPVNSLADTGWNVDYITVSESETAADIIVTETEPTANINHLTGTETLLDKDDTGDEVDERRPNLSDVISSASDVVQQGEITDDHPVVKLFRTQAQLSLLSVEQQQMLANAAVKGDLAAAVVVTGPISPGQVALEEEGATAGCYEEVYSPEVNVKTDVTNDGIVVSIDSEETEGKTILVDIHNNALSISTPGDINVLYDGQRIDMAGSYADVLDPNNDEFPEYLVLVGATSIEVFVSIPHFSRHIVKIEPASSGVQPQKWLTVAIIGSIMLLASFYVMLRKQRSKAVNRQRKWHN
jgi:predicted secreted protein